MNQSSTENIPSLDQAFDIVLQEYIRLAPIIMEYRDSFFRRLKYASLSADQRPEITLEDIFSDPPSKELSLLELHILRTPISNYTRLTRNQKGPEHALTLYLSAIANDKFTKRRIAEEDDGVLANKVASQLYHHLLKKVAKDLNVDIECPPDFFDAQQTKPPATAEAFEI